MLPENDGYFIGHPDDRFPVPFGAGHPGGACVLEKVMKKFVAPLCVSASCLVLGIAVVGGSFAIADPKTDKMPDKMKDAMKGMPEMKLPDGWTQKDMEACMAAGMPGEMHKKLMEGAGTWTGKTKMWMAPGTEPMNSECTVTLTPMFEGRYLKCEHNGDMPGMGPFSGFGMYGFDNVDQKFHGTWVDNHSTGIMTGVGEMSSDGTMTMTYTFNCPIQKKPATMREVKRHTGKDTCVMELYMTDPKSNKEYKMMETMLTRKN
jgi:hypothetical protein